MCHSKALEYFKVYSPSEICIILLYCQILLSLTKKILASEYTNYLFLIFHKNSIIIHKQIKQYLISFQLFSKTIQICFAFSLLKYRISLIGTSDSKRKTPNVLKTHTIVKKQCLRLKKKL